MNDAGEIRKPKRAKRETKSNEDTPDVVPEELIGENKNTAIQENSDALKALQEFGNSKYMNYLFLDGDSTTTLALVEALGGASNIQEALTIDNMEDAFRRSVYLSFESTVTIYEGEVTEIKILKDELEEVKEIQLVLMAVKGSKVLKLGRQFHKVIRNINVGDVVYIEPASGLLRRIGRSESRCDEYDLEGDKYVQLNKGQVNNKKRRHTKTSLYDFDFSLSGHSASISAFTRRSVDEIVKRYVSLGAVKFEDSSFVISSAHLLGPEPFAVLNRCVSLYPWVKVLLIGHSAMAAFPLDDFLVVKAKDENLVELLKNRHSKFEGVSELVKKYIGKVPLEKMEDAIAAASTASEFVALMELK